eukprot:TRINITY_DN15739_c0_g1_i3.p1 TRINITY_DN15739_c0_g1~~TRINITY_DN15739_c0_g1_i3.p1  ORF type:complete len:558 (+),score=120.31 TRINITY_DN15739_c0_g1_i3:339-2012(+)
MSSERIPESERRQIEHIRELESEELQVEEVDDSSSDGDHRYFEEVNEREVSREGQHLSSLITSESRDDGGFTYITYLDSLLADSCGVGVTHNGLPSSDGGGTILSLPMFYLEGIVLFPEGIIPLTVLQPRFIAAAKKAMKQVCVYKRPSDTAFRLATMGTTAEIRQYQQMEDGSVYVAIYGQQRFRLRRLWVDGEGVPWAEVQIVQEDRPLRMPKEAFGQLASVSNIRNCGYSHAVLSAAALAKSQRSKDDDFMWEYYSSTSTDSDHPTTDVKMQRCPLDFCDCYGNTDESMSSDNEQNCDLGHMSRRSHPSNSESECQPHIHDTTSESDDGSGLESAKESVQGREAIREWKKVAAVGSKWLHRAPRSFWPHWVYRMYDSYFLAWRLADMWSDMFREEIDIYGVVNTPDILSFQIARQIPLPVFYRQELLEIVGVTNRLRREIELLEQYNLIRCKTCLAVFAKRADMMDKHDGPLGAYAQVHDYVHEIMILQIANGLTLIGSPVEKDNWFPGYAWTIAACVKCESSVGWFFTSTKKLQPKSFFGIRYSQIADAWGRR